MPLVQLAVRLTAVGTDSYFPRDTGAQYGPLSGIRGRRVEGKKCVRSGESLRSTDRGGFLHVRSFPRGGSNKYVLQEVVFKGEGGWNTEAIRNSIKKFLPSSVLGRRRLKFASCSTHPLPIDREIPPLHAS